jgi:DNA-binding NarL/FixJ family response regulator
MINNEVTIDLTKREVQVVKLICKELTNKEIAEKLGLKVRTIEDYKANILKKIKARNSVGIHRFAIRKGIIKI